MSPCRHIWVVGRECRVRCTRCGDPLEENRDADAATPAQMCIADHIEIHHERELAGVAPGALAEVHQQLHDHGDDWDHTHGAGGQVLYR